MQVLHKCQLLASVQEKVQGLDSLGKEADLLHLSVLWFLFNLKNYENVFNTISFYLFESMGFTSAPRKVVGNMFIESILDYFFIFIFFLLA